VAGQRSAESSAHLARRTPAPLILILLQERRFSWRPDNNRFAHFNPIPPNLAIEVRHGEVSVAVLLTALNCDSRRAVNLRDVAHVAQAFFARRLRLPPILDAVGEVVGFGQEVRRVARRVEFVKFPARTISAQPQSFVDEGRVDFEPAFRSMDAIEAFHVGAVGSVATRYDARRELHCPGDILLHFIEAAVLIDDRGIGRDAFRFLAGQVTACVE
jgi:hypothetical protein